MAIARLVVDVNANLSGLQRDLDAATGAIRRFASGLTDIGAKLTIGITAPLAALGVTVGKASADFDSLKRGLEAVAGSSNAAQEQLKRLEELARMPGLGFREAIQGSVRLQAVGLSVAMTERALRSFGNAVALTGGGKAELDRITVQLGQLSGKGRVLAQDMRLIMDAAPATGRALREAFGTTDTEAIQKLNLTTEQFLTRLFDALDRLPRVTGGVKNSFENLTDSLYRAKVAIGNQLLPTIVPLVEGLTRTLEAVRTLDPNMVRWAIAIGAVAAVLGPMILVVGQLTTAVTALTAAIGIAGLAGTIATGGILLLLGGLSAMFVKNKLDALAAASAADTYRASLIGLSRGQLLSNLIAEQSKLSELHVSQSALRRTGRAFETGFDDRAGRPKFGERGFWKDWAFGNFTRPPDPLGSRSMVRRETGEMRALGEEANATGRRVADLKKALELLNAVPPGGTAPVALPGGGGKDRFAGLLDSLTDRIRELEVLRRFGVATADALPESLQQVDEFGQVFTASIPQQIRLVNSLSDELDRLRDGLGKLQQAGRQPPAGLIFGIGELSRQLVSATRDLRTLENEWQRSAKLMFGSVDIRLPRVQAGPLPERDRERLGSPGRLFGGDIPERVGGLDAVTAAVTETLTQFGRSVKEFGTSQLNNAISGLAGMVAQLTPAGMAATVLSSAMEALRPVMEALFVPLNIIGEILAALIIPVLKLLFQPLKILGIVVSYIGEVIAKVAGAIATAIGSLVRGIGRLVNKLPGSPGDPLVKAGQAMINLGKEFKDAAGEMAKRRKELEGLSFDDAVNGVTEGLDRLSDSLSNVPPLFNVALRRMQASIAQSIPASGPLGPPAFSPPKSAPPTQPAPSGPTVIVLDGEGNRKPETSATRQLLADLARKLEGASDPKSKAVGLAMRMAT